MDPAEKPAKRIYVVLLFVNVNKDYYSLKKSERAKLTNPHVKELTEHLTTVSLTSLQATGLSKDIMIEVLESENLLDIEKMIETYKAGAKSKYGSIENVIITEKCMERKRTG
jgi:hypothetical protein